MSHADDGSVPVASEAAGASSTPGAALAPRTVESEQDKMVRYLPGLLVARDGLSAED